MKEIRERAIQEYYDSDPVLWENEIKANIFVAKISLICAAMLIMCCVLDYIGLFDVDFSIFLGATIRGSLELIIPALICFALKGKKKWIKSILCLFFTFAMCEIQYLLTYSVVLLMIFPIVLSVKYYSRTFTNTVAIINTIIIGIVMYLSISQNIGLNDLNYQIYKSVDIYIPAGSSIRAALSSLDVLDPMASWYSFLTRVFSVRFLHYTIVCIVCSSIADNGRKAIYEQKAQAENNARIKGELSVATDIQANMLPNIFPAFPERNDFDIYATMNPAKEVGGDFYDFFMINDNHLGLVIGDVSGKGVPAAMFMVIAKTLIKDHAQLGLDADEVFMQVNDKLCEGNKIGLFVTCFMAIVDLDSGVMTYVNAGHNPPVLKHNGKIKFLKCRPGFVLAGMEGMHYKQESIQINRGDKLFLYTDGISEATNSKNELYNDNRLIECIRSLGNISVKKVIEAVNNDVEKFVGDAPQFDDMTMLAFDYSYVKENNHEENI